MAFNIMKCLKRCPLFRDFEEDEVNAIFDCLRARVVVYSKGAIIVKKGDPADEIGIILDGAGIAFSETLGNKKVVEKELLEGDTFGEVDGYLDERVYPYSVVIASPEAHVMFITVSTIVKQCSKTCPYHQKLLTNTLRTLAERVHSAKQDNDYLSIKSMRLKIAKLIYAAWEEQRSDVVFLGKNRNEMAEYLNVSRPSMSREMMRMRDERIIDFWKDKITILDLSALREIVAGE